MQLLHMPAPALSSPELPDHSEGMHRNAVNEDILTLAGQLAKIYKWRHLMPLPRAPAPAPSAPGPPGRSEGMLGSRAAPPPGLSALSLARYS